jgi:hypothetical protein
MTLTSILSLRERRTPQRRGQVRALLKKFATITDRRYKDRHV